MLGHDGIHNKMNMNFDINGRSEQHIQFSDVASGGAAVLMTKWGWINFMSRDGHIGSNMYQLLFFKKKSISGYRFYQLPKVFVVNDLITNKKRHLQF